MTLLYISGKYNADTHQGIVDNILAARKVAVNLWEQGFSVICPHQNTQNFEVDSPNTSHDTWLRGDLEILSRCDVIIMLPDWEESSGANVEYELAKKYEIPIYYWPDHPEISYFESHKPEKIHEIMKALMNVYRSYVREE